MKKKKNLFAGMGRGIVIREKTSMKDRIGGFSDLAYKECNRFIN